MEGKRRDFVPRRPRLEDVAEAAGVSKSIASRVLNGDPSVSVRDATRTRITTVARELGYRPHVLARALAGAGTGALALLVPAFENPAFAELIRGADERARERGYVLLSAEDAGHAGGREADEAFTELVRAGRIDGLMIASALPARSLLAALERHWIPHVFVNRAVPGATTNVVLDVEAASELAFDHLAALGHERLGHIAGPPEIESARRREEAFLAAAHARGLEPVVVRAAFSHAGGEQAAHQLLDEHPGVGALWVSSFVQAVGALRALADAGVDVPGDVSLLSFEDVPTADYTIPRLTTIAMPMHALGARSVDVLLERLDGAPPGIHRLSDQPRLVVRDSTGPGGGARGRGERADAAR
jgi:DNA-binding LacI/PurR family transcriptional regulator